MPVYVPPEVWLRIFEVFCPHCRGGFGRYPNYLSPRNAFVPIQPTAPSTLAQVCRVSKQFNTLATPVLYHVPFPHDDYSNKFLGTLFRRPELGVFVRDYEALSWRYGNGRALFSDFPPELRPMYQHKMEILQTEAPDAWPAVGPEEVYIQIVNALVLAMMPRLVFATLESDDVPICPALTPGYFPHLKSIYLHKKFNDIAIFPEALVSLANGAPNLANLDMSDFAMDDATAASCPIFPHVTDLQIFIGRITPSAWAVLLRNFPRLETIDYMASGHELDAKPIQVQTALLNHLPLKRLRFKWGESLGPMGPWSQAECFDRGLSKLRLEDLELDHYCLQMRSEQPSRRFEDMLPDTLRRFAVNYSNDGPTKDIDQWKSLAASADQRLPRLSTVNIKTSATPAESPQCARIAEAWGQAAADLVFGFDF